MRTATKSMPQKLFSTLGIVFFISLFLFSAHPIQADYAQSQSEYQQAYTAYREAHTIFNAARSEYLTYKTLVSETQATHATQQMLIQRHKALVAYLNMLRERLKLAENAYIPRDQYALIIKQMDVESSSLTDFESLIENAESLDDLFRISSQADARILRIGEIGYMVKAQVMTNKVWEFVSISNDLLSVTNEQVERITREGISFEKSTNLSRYLIDAREKMNLANVNLEITQALANKVKKPADFAKLQTELQKTMQYIENTNTLVKEIVTNIKIE